MNVWNDLDAFPTGREPVVATVGNFDGVHLGHQAILTSVLSAARARGAPSLLITFDPHPLAVVSPTRRPRLLMSRRQKVDALHATRLDGLLILPFDRELAALTGQQFFEDILGSRIRFAEVHVGRNFRFGQARSGDLRSLEAIGASHGFRVVGVPQVELDGETVSSSAIRAAVEDGDVDRACRMSGRPFALVGEVVRGEGRGRRLDYPTANLAPEGELTPKRGVYVTEAVTWGVRHAAVTNVGTRPTFGDGAQSVETHVLDFDDDLYGERIEIRFLTRLRDEMTFQSPRELSDQIARDLAAAQAYFSGLKIAAAGS